MSSTYETYCGKTTKLYSTRKTEDFTGTKNVAAFYVFTYIMIATIALLINHVSALQKQPAVTLNIDILGIIQYAK